MQKNRELPLWWGALILAVVGGVVVPYLGDPVPTIIMVLLTVAILIFGITRNSIYTAALLLVLMGISLGNLYIVAPHWMTWVGVAIAILLWGYGFWVIKRG